MLPSTLDRGGLPCPIFFSLLTNLFTHLTAAPYSYYAESGQPDALGGSLVPARSLFAEVRRRRHLPYHPLVGFCKPALDHSCGLWLHKSAVPGLPCARGMLRETSARIPVAQGSLLYCWCWALALFGSMFCGAFLFVPFRCSFSIVKLLAPHRCTSGVAQSNRVPSGMFTHAIHLSRQTNSLSFLSNAYTNSSGFGS